jgi:hypothetical protein
MKKIKLLLAGSLFTGASLFAGSGIFDSFAIVESTFYDLNATTANADYSGANLGSFDTTDSISIGGQLKSFKNNGTDVTGALLSYVIYAVGSRPATPTFNDVSYAFQIDNVGGNSGDQQWGTNVDGSNATDVAASASLSSLSAGDYKLEVFAHITTNGIDAASEIFDNNGGGGNYIADFTVVPESGSFALIVGALGMGFVALRRRRR